MKEKARCPKVFVFVSERYAEGAGVRNGAKLFAAGWMVDRSSER